MQKRSIDWMILTVFQPVSGYIMPRFRESRSSYVYIYSFYELVWFEYFYYVLLMLFFKAQFYQILIIFTEIYLTHRWDFNRYCREKKFVRPGSKGNEEELHTSQVSWIGSYKLAIILSHTQDSHFGRILPKYKEITVKVLIGQKNKLICLFFLILIENLVRFLALWDKLVEYTDPIFAEGVRFL